MTDTNSATRTLAIGSSHGLHARPAKLFVQEVTASGASVTIAKGDGKAVNAASMLMLISQGINHGDEVTVTVTGDDAEQIADRLAEFLSTDHYEA